MSEPRYPLAWPEGWARAKTHRNLGGHQNQTWHKVVTRLQDEFDNLGATDVVLSTNCKPRLDGTPSSKGTVSDAGVAVYFTLKGKRLVMAQDTYWSVEDNMRSLALALEGLRQVQRHGGAVMLERAFTGFEALPNPDAPVLWFHVLGVPEDASSDEIRRAHARAARACHPDQGGDDARMAQVNAAWEQAKQLGKV